MRETGPFRGRGRGQPIEGFRGDRDVALLHLRQAGRCCGARGTWVSFRWFLRGRTVDRSALVEVRLGRAVARGLGEAGALRREGHEDRGEAGVVVAEVDLGALAWPSVPRRVDLGDALDEVRDGSGDGRVVLQLAARGVGAQARGLDDV